MADEIHERRIHLARSSVPQDELQAIRLRIAARRTRRPGAESRRHLPLLIASLASLLVLAWAHRQPLAPLSAPPTPPAVSAAFEGEAVAPLHTMTEWEEPSVTLEAPAATRAGGSMANNSTLGTWYHIAAAEYGVDESLLRALHQVETNAAPDGCVANLQASGAVGPFQFKPATFKQYGVDANLDGKRDICSFTDALFSAARYLSVLGARDADSAGTRNALVRYGTDPDRVLVLARHYNELAAGSR